MGADLPRPRRALRPARVLPVLALLLGVAAALACQRAEPPPNVLLVVVDTLRKDALHLYGEPRPSSPTIDALGARGWVFENHVAHASQTVPSTLSLLLSQLPLEHGFPFRDPRDFYDERPVFPDDLHFLAEVFREHGYATAGFVGNPYLTHRSGFSQGFDAFRYDDGAGERLTRLATRWLEERRDEPRRPFFLYLHYMDAHQPYEPPEPWATRFAPQGEGRVLFGNGPAPADAGPSDRAYTWARYLACVAYVDHQIGEVVAALDRLGRRGDTLIAVTSDHGEEFLEHGGLGHGTTVFGPQVRVPLVLVWPERLEPGRRVPYLSKHLDLAPTLLELAGLPRPDSFRGRSVLAPASKALVDTGPWRGVYADGWNLARDVVHGEERLFSQEDELDLAPVDAPEERRSLEQLLADYLARDADARATRADPTGERSGWSSEETERLRALGYVQ